MVHVHEIPDGLKLQVFRRLLQLDACGSDLQFEGDARRLWAARTPTQHVVYNGIAAPAAASRATMTARGRCAC